MKTGVYQIRNLVNGKRYIGSAAGKGGFQARWRVSSSLNSSMSNQSLFQISKPVAAGHISEVFKCSTS